MKRRVLSFIVALTLCLNLFPVGAFAASVGSGDGLCPHHPVHTDECGYAEGDPGAPCTFVCPICPIEALIDGLPGSVTQSNAGQVQAQIEEIYALYDALADGEREQVDLSPCAALLEQVDGLGSAQLSDSSLPNNDEEEFQRNTNLEEPFPITKAKNVFLNGYTLTAESSNAITVTGTGRLYLVGGGSVISKKGSGVEVQSGGFLSIAEPGVTVDGSKYGVYVSSGAEVHLSAGSYSGKTAAIYVEDGNYAAVLEAGFTCYDSAGNPILPADLAAAKSFTVGQCTDHSSKTYTHAPGTTEHTWTCTACKLTGTEPCTFSFDQDGRGTCVCGSGLTIDVNQEDLSDLVYDGTLKPEQVRVAVTLTDGSNKELVKDTDYKVEIVSITNAGQATVTVTGITFGGTFVKTYTVAQATPGIKWADTTKELAYDGSAVTAGELPDINITINTPSGEDLHPFLKYAYSQNGADFTDGLPTNAGVYQVKAYLEESQNYEAAVTDPLLTLTIKPIDPIVTAPAAAKPTYNGAAQALVTSGALDPVAAGDGLEIQFATNAAGPYSAAIPTETNAGDYRVWYTVKVPAAVAGNYNALNPDPTEVTGVEILRRQLMPAVTLSEYTYLYDGGFKEPKVTVKDEELNAVLPETEYQFQYVNNQNVSTDTKPAKVVVEDLPGGNYDIKTVETTFKITRKIQDTLSITQKPNTVTYGDQFTLSTDGGSGNGLVTWKITDGADVAEVDENSGEVTIIGDGSATVQATKSGKDPATGVVNYEDATAAWTLTARQKPVIATVTAEDKIYDGNTTATVHAVVESGVLPGDEITITDQNGNDLTGTFSDANAGADKTVTVDFSNAKISGNHSEHYAVSYSATTVKAAIRKATPEITDAPTPKTGLIYNGSAQTLIDTAAVVNPATGIPVEYALSEDGPYSTDFPMGTNAGTYTVWYRVQETPNYTGLAPASVQATINKKSVAPTITLNPDTFVYDGTAKEPVVTLKEADNSTVIPADEYTVTYANNVNVSTDGAPATVTVTAKAGGNYEFTAVTKNFEITKEQAEVVTAPEAAGDPLTFSNRNQALVTGGTGTGGTMVYSLTENGTYNATIPTGFDAKDYRVYYKVQGDGNHSDSDVGHVDVTIAPKTVDPTIELFDGANPLVSYTYDGTAKEPRAVVKDGSTEIANTEYNIVYIDNKNAGHATVSITDKPGGNYTVTGSATFEILKADIVFSPAPEAATLTYNGSAQELLVEGTTTGGTVLYALGSSTAQYHDYIPTATEAGDYTVYYKVDGDENHNDFAITKVDVTIGRKQLTDITIELTPASFPYDGQLHLPTAVTVKFTEGRTETVVPTTEYDWACNVASPTAAGTYTITITDAAGGNYDLRGANPNTATFTIGQAAQEKLVIESKPDSTVYGDTFQLTVSGGSGTGTVTWAVTSGNATIDGNGNVTITGVGQVIITATNPGDQNYLPVSDQWTFTAAPKPVTATVTVSDKAYDGNTAATVTAASIATINGDTVTIDPPASITATFDTPNVGTDKTVTLDTSSVQVTGDTAKYDITYPGTVTADVTKATTTIDTDPEAIAPLTYTGQPLALITAGQTNVGFLAYSTDGANFSRDIPTGTDAGTYDIYYKVEGTADYTAVNVNATPISVTIAPKPITPKVELSESSFLYDGTKKNPTVTVKDGNVVIDPGQYSVTWANDDTTVTDGLLTAAGKYTATITNVANGNYSFTATAKVEIKEATQGALDITGTPEHVYYGDKITTLKATGGTGNGTLKWSVTAGNATIDETTGDLTITGAGSVTVKAERTVPNYATATGTWTFTVDPKPVVAEVTVVAKDYDGTTGITNTAITAQVKASDLVNGDTVTISGLTGAYEDANAGTGKTVTLNSTGAAVGGVDAAKYAVSYPATAKGDINPRGVTVTVTLSGNDLQGNATDGYYYNYDGNDKTPTVTAKATDDNAVLTASDYSVSYTDNKNVGTAAVTVTAKEGGNYTFTAETVNFEIRKAGAVLTTTPLAKDLTYTGAAQELVTVGVATGGKVVYSKTGADSSYSETIPQETNAGTYTVYYKVEGDGNHDGTAPSQVSVTIKPKEITPKIELSQTSYVYDGTAKTPTVTVKDGTGDNEVTIPNTEYTVSYRDNINAGTATVTVSDANGGNYIVNGTATFEITKAAPTVTAPTAKTGLYYTGEAQELVNAGVCHEGAVVYSLNGGNYSTAIPMASARGTYTIDWKVQGDANHSDTAEATLTVEIAKNAVNNPTITLSQDEFTYNGNLQKPAVTVYDKDSRLIPETEYMVTFTVADTDGTEKPVTQPVDVGKYTLTIAATANSNYEFTGTLTRTFDIVPADQETISITGTKTQVRYGDEIQLGATGGADGGTVTWEITGNTGTTLTQNGLLTVKDVNTSIKVTVKRTRPNYGEVSASWEFTAAKKPVTAVLTGVDRDYIAGDKSATVKATVDAGDLVFGDTLTIDDLAGTFDNENVGTNKTITVTGTVPANDKYDVTIPATATGSILPIPATCTAPEAVDPLTYKANQAQELVTAGTATGGTMVYSLDGANFTLNIPKGEAAGDYTVHYKAQGDQNHTDSAVGTVNVTIGKQTVTPQIELSPPSGKYDGKVQRPAVTVRDAANNVIPNSEYTVVYDPATNWTDVRDHTVTVKNIEGGNYIVTETNATFTISTSDQAPLEIVNKPGKVYYGDDFTLSATGGSGSEKVQWSSSNENIAKIDENGFVIIVGTGTATITAKKEGGGNYGDATATYPLNALPKPVTAAFTADDKEYDGNTNATIHDTWSGLVGNDAIDTSTLNGAFADANVGTGKTVTITGDPVNDATAQKYDITINRTTTASITKATAAARTLTGNTPTYNGAAQDLVSGGDANTRYSDARDGVYSTTVPQGTNAGTYTVWYKQQGDANHNDSEPQSIQVTISPKLLALTDANITLSGNDLQSDANGYFYQYDGTEKKPAVTIKDGSAEIPSSEYTVSYADNKNVTTTDKKATVTIKDNEGGNYTVSGTATFEIRAGGAQLDSAPQANNLTYIGPRVEQPLVTMGAATGGHLEYKLRLDPDTGTFSPSVPTGIDAGTYTVDYKVVGDGNHDDGPTGSVTVVIQPKPVVSPKITVTGAYTYDGNPQIPEDGAVTVEDGGTVTIPTGEYTLSYQNNVNAGTATVIVTDNTGGNYTVSGTGTFTIAKAPATGTAPTGKTGLKYNGTAQELIMAGSSSDGTVVYSLNGGDYYPAIPTASAVATGDNAYSIAWKVLGDANHSDMTPNPDTLTVEIAVNNVANPTIQVDPPSVKYIGEKQEPTVTVKDDSGLVIDDSEYTVAWSGNLTDVGTYTGTITGGANYNFVTTDGKNTAAFAITPADQTALTITGTRERVYYGDNISLGTTGGTDGGTVTWKVNDGAPASIDANGLLTITGVGQVTVTATSTKTGYANQTATWKLYADPKPVTAIVTAKAKTYDGDKNATVTATLQTSDFVGADRFTITLTGAFEDANAGTDKKVNVDSTNPEFNVTAGGANCYKNYAITYPGPVTASISKANIDTTKVIPPEKVDNLTYTGLPLALVREGSSPDGIMEYSLDGKTYSASLPTGTSAVDYEVWYRVKGDGNHNDTAGTKMDGKVTIDPQPVSAPIIEFTPNSPSFDGKEHKPEVTVKDSNNRVIPADEYTVAYGAGDWTKAGDYEVTVTDKDGGNYTFTETKKTFTILVAGQSSLSITNKPGKVQYGDTFTLSAVGGSIGTVTWESSAPQVASIADNGTVTVHMAGSVTITAKKLADGNYGEVSDTWSFSAEKKPVTAIVTADDKEYDGSQSATLRVAWNGLVNNDTLTVTGLTGTFDSADAGTGKTVNLNHTSAVLGGTNAANYDVTYPDTATASITPKAATLSGSTATTLTYNGSAQDLVGAGVTATNGTLVYSTDGSYYTQTVPTGRSAGSYPVWYKAQASGNYKDSDPVRLNVAIEPKEVENPVIELSQDSFEYDGSAKRPDVVVKDSSKVIPASEYTVSYSNNTNAGTATVTITDNEDGNYTVNGSKTFTITAGGAELGDPPQPNDLTYNGSGQALVTRGTAVNGTVVYSETETGTYTTRIPEKTNAGTYQVWYKVKGANGAADTEPDHVSVTIKRKTISAEVLLDPEEFTYSGDPCEPEVFVVDLDSGDLLNLDTDYTVRYMSNNKVGSARVIVTGKGNYSFSVMTTFEITAAKAKFTTPPTPVTGLKYNGTAQKLVNAGEVEGGTAYYSLDGVNYSALIPSGTARGGYVVYAKVRGDETHEDSAAVEIPVEIDVNTVANPVVTLSAGSFPYTGVEQQPTVTVRDGDGGNVISADEYTVTYSGNVNVGTATVSIQSKPNGNYSFRAETTFQIIDASQTPLTIGGKKDAVYYGDTLQLTASGGSGNDTVTWNSSDPAIAEVGVNSGTVKIKTSGSVTITATKGSLSESWTFYAQPKPITAVVTAANKPYDGNNTAALTVTISSGLVGSDSITTNTDDGVKAEGHFSDETVGTNKTVVITGLTVPAEVSAKYDISCNPTTTASINPAPATVLDTDKPALAAGPLTYNGGAQDLLESGGTAVGGNLAYSLDGSSYSYTIPTGTDAGKYTVWYKVEASDENHRDSAAVKLGDVTISANTDTPTVLCTPSTFQYDGTEKTPTVVVRDSQNRIIPESEYTVELPTPRIAVKDDYTVTVTDNPGGNYEFSGTVTGAFEIVSAAQNPLNIVTNIPTDVHYGDTFRLSVNGGSGSGAIHWEVKGNGSGTPAAITATGNSCVVKVTGTGGFTVEAYREASDGYSQSNTDSVPFEAKAKPVAPVVTASEKTYDGKTDAVLTARWNSGDLVNGDKITLTVEGQFATADAGVNKQVNITGHTAVGENVDVDKYVITWPDSTTGTINKVDAKLETAPAAADLAYTGEALPLVTAGETMNGIGTIEYSTSQNGAYSETIPTETNAGRYEVWYKVADSVNYTGIAPASITVEIKKANPAINTNPSATGGFAGDPLSSFSLGGAATEVPGTFAWENPDIEAVAGTAYNVTFTPDDTANYNTVTIQVVAVSSSTNGGSGGGGGTSSGGGSSGGGTGGSGGGSGTSSGGSSNGTGGSISTDADTLTYSTGAPVVQGNTASFAMSTFDGSRMARQATANQSKNIVIQPEITGNVTKTQVSIPASTASQINSQTDAALTVASPIADVTIPNGALDTLGRAGGTVNVVTEQTKDGAVALTLTAGGETVDSVPGGVTLAVPAENAGPGTVAVLVGEDGTREVLQRSVVKDGKVSAPLSGSGTVEIVDNGKSFDDVPDTSWASEAVTFASARGLFNGTSETTFSPEETTSRGMVATVLYRLEGQPDQALTDLYSDVSDEDWYADSVAWAAENGIVNGYGDGQFGPNDSVTREQFVVMLWRYLGSPKASNHDLTAFTDADQISSYALEALSWAVENGVLNGNGGGQLVPGGTATRAEAAQILKNFIENT